MLRPSSLNPAPLAIHSCRMRRTSAHCAPGGYSCLARRSLHTWAVWGSVILRVARVPAFRFPQTEGSLLSAAIASQHLEVLRWAFGFFACFVQYRRTSKIERECKRLVGTGSNYHRKLSPISSPSSYAGNTMLCHVPAWLEQHSSIGTMTAIPRRVPPIHCESSCYDNNTVHNCTTILPFPVWEVVCSVPATCIA